MLRFSRHLSHILALLALAMRCHGVWPGIPETPLVHFYWLPWFLSSLLLQFSFSDDLGSFAARGTLAAGIGMACGCGFCEFSFVVVMATGKKCGCAISGDLGDYYHGCLCS